MAKVKEHVLSKKSKHYVVKDGQIVSKSKECPKCGGGVFMGNHKDRYSCGACGYTEWKSTK